MIQTKKEINKERKEKLVNKKGTQETKEWSMKKKIK
jgi:hypothetical protein